MSAIRADNCPPSISISPRQTGRENRLEPALPGLKYRTPSRQAMLGWWEWPWTTALKPAAPRVEVEFGQIV